MSFMKRLRRKIKRLLRRYGYHPAKALYREQLRRRYVRLGRWLERRQQPRSPFVAPPPRQSAHYEPAEPRTDPLPRFAARHAHLEAKRAQARAETERVRRSLRDATETQATPIVSETQTGPIPRRYTTRQPDKRTSILHPHHLERPATDYHLQAYRTWQGDEWVK